MRIICIPVFTNSVLDKPVPLLKTNGKTLLRYVFEAACRSRLTDKIIITSNDPNVLGLASSWGAFCWLSKERHQTGTRRVAEAVFNLATHASVVINLSAHEPNVPASYLDALSEQVNYTDRVSTLAGPLLESEADKQSVVKVVASKRGKALYFSRDRMKGAAKHVGVYGYSVKHLERIEKMPCPMASQADLEQLDWMDNGMELSVLQVDKATDAIRTSGELDNWQPPIDTSHVFT